MHFSRLKKIEQVALRMTVPNPFIFGAHHVELYPKGNEIMGPEQFLPTWNAGNDFSSSQAFRMYHGTEVPGFPEHPHRGFETVTIMNQGFTDHFDSVGNCGRYAQGDVQWLTAGAGVEHCEMFPLLSRQEENPLDLFQLWLNLPSQNKFVLPAFRMLWREQIPVIHKVDDGGNKTKLKIIAGAYEETSSLAPLPNSWAADKNHHVRIWQLELEPLAVFTIPPTTTSASRYLYLYEGDQITVDGDKLIEKQEAEVEGEAAVVIENGGQRAKILWLEGEPINEPVLAHGPFVMNTRDEIIQAYEDYEKTRFGNWDWGKPDPVHAREKGRFASYQLGERVDFPIEN